MKTALYDMTFRQSLMNLFNFFKIKFRSGDIQSAMQTAKKLIDMYPDGHAHVLAGIVAFKNEVTFKFLN